MVLISCGNNNTPKRNILTVAIEGNPTNLNPLFATDAYSSRIDQLIFNGLMKFDKNGNLIPDIAERYEIEANRIYTFYLRKGIFFHNGKEFDAKDVKYTFDILRDPKNLSPKRESYKIIKRIEIIDKYKVRFILKESYAPFLTTMVIGILPEGCKDKFIGTGPFIFSKWVKDERVELTANKRYFEGSPKIDGILIRIIPNDITRILELKKGNIDFILNAIPPEFIKEIKKDKRFLVIKKRGTTYAYLGFNLKDKILRNKKVREAFAYGIDRERIVKNILKDTAEITSSLLSPLNWAYEGKVKVYNYDKDKARELLREAGLKDGFKVTYKTSKNELRIRIAQVIQENLKDIGIQMEIRSYEWGTFYSDIKNGNFQICTLQWVGITDPDIYYYIFHSSSIPPNGANRGFYINPKVDKLLEEGRRIININRRKKIYSEVQKILADDLPYISLWHMDNIVVIRKNVKGFILSPNGDFTFLKDVWIDD